MNSIKNFPRFYKFPIDTWRESFNYIYFKKDKIYFTDGTVLFCLSRDRFFPDEGNPLPEEFLIHAKNSYPLSLKMVKYYEIKDGLIVPLRSYYPFSTLHPAGAVNIFRKKDMEYPDVEKFIKKIQRKKYTESKENKVCFSSNVIKSISTVFPDKQIKFFIDGEKKPVWFIEAESGDFGLIMPYVNHIDCILPEDIRFDK